MTEVENGCVCPIEADSGGMWRKGEFVRWTDLFVFLEAILVWLGLVVVGMVVAAAVLSAQHQPGQLLAQRLTELAREPAFHYAFSASLYLVMLAFFVRVARRVADKSLAARFRPLSVTTVVISVLIGMALAVVMSLVIGVLTQHNMIKLEATTSELSIVPHSLPTWLAGLGAIGLIGPFTEELYFRGILLGWLTHKMPVAAAVPLSALLFGLIHFSFVTHQGLGGWVVTGVITLVGLIAAILALKTRSLWAAFSLHAGYNSVLISLPMLQIFLR